MFKLSIKRGSKLQLAIAALLLLVGGLTAFAQLPTATILGTVKDSTGAVIVDATVTVTNLDQNVTRTEKTGGDGWFRFPVLAVGNYKVQASHQGFNTETKTGLVLTVNQDAEVTFSLAVGSTKETVAVTADVSQQVDTVSSTLGSLVNGQKIEDLPLNGRNFVNLTLLQPGVSQHTDMVYGNGQEGTLFSVDGAQIRSNNFMLDGAVLNNFYGGNASSIASTTLGSEGIKEYQVVTNLAPAEYGLNMGSQTVMVSKSGTNQLHGSLYEYLRNSVLDARNYFDKLYTLPLGVPGGGDRIAPFKRNQFGGSIGGPIKKDKTFIFGDYESFLEVQDNPPTLPITTVFSKNCYNSTTQQLLYPVNPCAIGDGNTTGAVAPIWQPFLALYPYPNVGNNQWAYLSRQPTKEYHGQVRLDQNFSAKDSLFGRYTVDDADVHPPGAYPALQDTASSRGQYSTISENHIFSSTLINTIRFSYSRTAITNTSFSGVGPGPMSFVAGQQLGGISIGAGMGVASVSGWGPDPSPGYHTENLFTLSDDVFWTKGKNAFKFGFLGNRFGLGEQEEFFIPANLMFTDTPSFFAAKPFLWMSGNTYLPNSNRYWLYDTLGFYAQDDYRASSRLTLNLGLRYEFFTVPHEMDNKGWRCFDIQTCSVPTSVATAPAAGWTNGPIMRNPSFKNFSPRVGFDYDVFGDGKTALRGGGGIYYDVAEDFGPVFLEDTLGTPPLSAVDEHLNVGPFATTITLPLTYTAADLGSSVTTLNYYIDQPYTVQYDLSVQRQLLSNVALTVAYVGARGIHLLGGPGTFPNPYAPLSITNGIPVYPVPSTCPRSGCARINPALGTVVDTVTHADSHYNALQATLTSSNYHGLQAQAGYTWQSSLDDGPEIMNNDAAGGNQFTDPFSGRVDYGPSNDDVKQNLRVSTIYHLPNVNSNSPAVSLLKGWFVGNILAAQGGYPFSPTVSGDWTNMGVAPNAGTERPNAVTSANLAAAQALNPNAVLYNPGTVIKGSPNGWFNYNMFTLGPQGTQGTFGRNGLRGPGLIDWDFSANKDTKLRFLGEGGNLEFRSEFFNIINHSNFGLPNSEVWATSSTGVATTTLAAPVAGVITNVVGSSRQIQFALRLTF